MACVEVTGSLCWEEPVKGPVVWADQEINNVAPESRPYEMLKPTWESGYGSGLTLPIFSGWAYKGQHDGPLYLKLWKYESIQFTTIHAGITVTFHFQNADDVEYIIPNVGFNPPGPHRIFPPYDYLTAITVKTNSFNNAPDDGDTYF